MMIQQKEPSMLRGKIGISVLLLITKIIAVLLIAAGVTYLSSGFHYFEYLIPGVEYGIWQGFPLEFLFKGYRVLYGSEAADGVIEWQPLTRWNYWNLVLDYLIYTVFIGGILFLVEKGLKKLLKITW